MLMISQCWIPWSQQREEREAEKKVEESQHRYLLAKKRLFEEKKENTRILNKITALGQKKMDLDKNLDSNDKAIFVIEILRKSLLIIKYRKKDKKIKRPIWIKKRAIWLNWFDSWLKKLKILKLKSPYSRRKVII